MTLAAGTRLGPYEIVAPLGAGGMGEVYRARDGRLQREVAIKVLPATFAADPERLARFTREAQTLAALNHPNIAQIHGLEESGETRALVMELVEGEDLAARIARGAIPLDEALDVARQIADALDAAHESGIIHRDLKPANVRVRPDGTVKVLDFGLAKALDPTTSTGGAGAPTLANSPTLTQHATQLGVILGSAAYMSPEQARGRAVDRRADIWAFGAVLFEMLTGQRAFEGEEITDVLASVLKTEPDLDVVPAETPPAVRRLLRRCLEKDPRRRLSSIHDARLELDEREAATPAAGTAEPPASRRPSSRTILAAVVATAVVTALASWLALRSGAAGGARSGAAAVARFSLLPPPGESFYADSTGVAISPDGRKVAALVGNATRVGTTLWVRSLDSPAIRPLESGEEAQGPFWSPDSRRIGYFSSRELKIISADGGRPQVVCDAPNGRGAAWNRDDQILFAPDASGALYRVSANGGTPVAVTALDSARGEWSHRSPQFLPDGDHFLFAVLPARNGRFDIYASSLANPSERTLIGELESTPIYVEPGWLLFSRRGVLTAQRFDTRALRLEGDAVALGDEPTMVSDPAFSYTAAPVTSSAADGTLAYVSAGANRTRAFWLGADGRPPADGADLPLPPGPYSALAISPDGALAALVRSVSPVESAIWLVELARGGGTPFSVGGGRNDAPVWSPDGSRIVFASDRDGPQNFYMKQLGAGGPELPIYSSPAMFKNPESWSADGRWILFQQLNPGSHQDILLLPADGKGEPVPFIANPARDFLTSPSPDGRWCAYVSEDSGQAQLYLTSFPEAGRRIQISRDGAFHSWWSRDGRELVWVDQDLERISRVEIRPAAGSSSLPQIGDPRRIFDLPPATIAVAPLPDFSRFLVLVPETHVIETVTVVQNWRAGLGK
ncbi:MAG: protein kinase [Thermoanaerobaculia bacterium]